MFGYVIANKEALTEPQLTRYRAYYCGVCHALRSRFGEAARFTLTYDTAFLAMLLSSLYEPDTKESRSRCLPHPKTPQLWLENEFTVYAADMNIALAYHNLLDDWQDDKNLPAKAGAALLKTRYDSVAARYPRQCGAIEAMLRALAEAETLSPVPADGAANAFGSLMGELFVYYEEDHWANTLRLMGGALGRFIYMADAYLDLAADEKKRRPNPLFPMKERGDFEETVKTLLTMHMGECALAFEKLPLIDDADILRNILYSGIWTRYHLHRQRKERRKA
ncbi:MAG: hypothetical protein E7330_03315 [Clostridiales bacterium]|nr:hypothetical protein [Clostridiales bacterium]